MLAVENAGDCLNDLRFARPVPLEDWFAPVVVVGTETPCASRQEVYFWIAIRWDAEGWKVPFVVPFEQAANAARLTDAGTVVGEALEFGLYFGKVYPCASRQACNVACALAVVVVVDFDDASVEDPHDVIAIANKLIASILGVLETFDALWLNEGFVSCEIIFFTRFSVHLLETVLQPG